MRSALRLTLLVGLVGSASPTAYTQQSGHYNRIDEPTRLAWERAGATFKVVFNLPGFAFRSGEVASLEQLRALPEPRVPFGLELSDVFTVPLFETLGQFKNLQALHSYACDPAALSGLPAVKELRHLTLNLKGNASSPAAVRFVRQLPHLTQLHARSLPITPEVVADIASLDRLDTLSLSFSDLDDEGLKRLVRLRKLHRLGLHATKVTTAGLAVLSQLPELKHLELGDWIANTSPEPITLSKPAPEAIARLTQLDSLSLIYPKNWEPSWMARLSGLPALRRLSIDFAEAPVTSADLGALSSMQALESLSIMGANISDDGLAAIGMLIRLRSLSLARSPVTDAGIAFIKNLGRLRELDVSGTDVTDAGVETILELNQLTTITLNSSITDKGLARLGTLPGLAQVTQARRPGTTVYGFVELAKAKPAVLIGDIPVSVAIKAFEIDAAILNEDPVERQNALERARAGAGPADRRQIDSALLMTLAANSPERAREIAPVLERVIAAIPSGSLPSRRLNEALLSHLEGLADQAALAPRVESFVSDALADVSDGPLRARALAVVGRAQLAQGRVARARSAITDSLRLRAGANPRDVAPLRAVLAQVEAASGNVAAAVESYISAAAAMTLTLGQEQHFRQLYERVYGADAGREAAVRRRNRELLPSPVKATPYASPAIRSTRLVLVELFTGSSCGPCAATDLAFDGLLDRYPPETVAALAYHANVPGIDPMTVRSAAQQPAYWVFSVPAVRIDGTQIDDLSGAAEKAPAAFRDLVSRIDSRLQVPTPARIALTAELTGDEVTVRAGVKGVPADANGARLQIVLAERELGFMGENGIRRHAMVVRAMAGGTGGGLPLGADGTVSHTFSLSAIRQDVVATLAAEIARRRMNGNKRIFAAEGRAQSEIDAAQLVVMAFVQQGGAAGDAAKAHVLQAAQANVVMR